jgi:predicted O-methyltransferase YrrM
LGLSIEQSNITVRKDKDMYQLSIQKLLNERPKWVTQGSLGASDSHFLFKTAAHARAPVAVEIGTASGFSTTVLSHALNVASQTGLIGADFRVISYDVSPKCLFNRSRDVGDAAREQLPADLLSHVAFRNPATAADFGKFHLPNEIGLLFIDGNHKHPWATLDLLAALPYLAPGGTVVLHDINLPQINPKFPDWGAQYLFDGLDVEKDVPHDSKIPNIGSFVVPEDKGALEAQLRRILYAHKWQVPVGDHYLRRLGLSVESPWATGGK